MKDKMILINFVVMILIIVIFGVLYVYMKINFNNKGLNESKSNIYMNEQKTNLIKDVEVFMFTNKNTKLIYDGGPSHWGSRTITYIDGSQTVYSKVANLHIIDESDLRGEFPKKEWNQKWEVNSDGLLYIDNVLMLKSPITVGNNWNIGDYTPIVESDKKYNANVKITSVVNDLNELNKEVKKVYTTLTIDDIKTVDGGIYTENRTFESGLGLTEVKVTEPTISQLILNYWLIKNK